MVLGLILRDHLKPERNPNSTVVLVSPFTEKDLWEVHNLLRVENLSAVGLENIIYRWTDIFQEQNNSYFNSF